MVSLANALIKGNTSMAIAIAIVSYFGASFGMKIAVIYGGTSLVLAIFNAALPIAIAILNGDIPIVLFDCGASLSSATINGNVSEVIVAITINDCSSGMGLLWPDLLSHCGQLRHISSVIIKVKIFRAMCVCAVANVKEEVENKLNDIAECFNAGISHSK
jgi:hypothetical protein